MHLHVPGSGADQEEQPADAHQIVTATCGREHDVDREEGAAGEEQHERQCEGRTDELVRLEDRRHGDRDERQGAQPRHDQDPPAGHDLAVGDVHLRPALGLVRRAIRLELRPGLRSGRRPGPGCLLLRPPGRRGLVRQGGLRCCGLGRVGHVAPSSPEPASRSTSGPVARPSSAATKDACAATSAAIAGRSPRPGASTRSIRPSRSAAQVA